MHWFWPELTKHMMRCTLCWREWTGTMQDEQCMDTKQFFIVFLSHIHVCKRTSGILVSCIWSAHYKAESVLHKWRGILENEIYRTMGILQWAASFPRVSDRYHKKEMKNMYFYGCIMQGNGQGAGRSPNKRPLTMGKTTTHHGRVDHNHMLLSQTMFFWKQVFDTWEWREHP